MMKTLIIRFSAMGDVAMTAPIVESMVRAYPEQNVTILTQKMLVPLFDDIPNVRTIGIKFADYKNISGLMRLYRELKKEKFDRVIDLHDVLMTKGLVFLFRRNGTPCFIISKGRKEKKALVSGKKRVALKPMLERYRDVFVRAGFPFTVPPRAVNVSWSIPKSVLDVAGEKNGKWYGVAPFAKHEGKRYPLNHTERLIEMLASNPNDRVFVFSGGGEEKKMVENIISKYPNVIATFGLVSLHGELELMSNLDTLVSMDSAAMHFASLAGLRVVSVWGATHHYAGFLGWGQDERDIVQLDLPCRPCSVYGNKPCRIGDYACMSGILPETIYEQVVNPAIVGQQ